jgi:hypothetical protein
MTSKATALNPEADFETPLKKQQENFESAVRKGYALATFVKPHFDRDKDDKAFVSFEISLALTEEHKKWVPDEIGEAWEVASEHGYEIKHIPVENQTCEILLAPDAKDGSLRVDVAEIEQAGISTVVEKGAGEEREVIRLKLRIKMYLDNDSGRFARVHFAHPVWLKLQPIQRKLIK